MDAKTDIEADLRARVGPMVNAKAHRAAEAGIEDGERFLVELGLDSLDCVELLLDIESELGVHIPCDDDDKLSTYGDLITYLTGLVGGNG